MHDTGGASAPQHAQAVRAVQLPDGSTEMAYEFDIALQVVALRGSIPADVNLEFRKALSKYGQFKLSQRSQLKDIFEELSNARQALHAIELFLHTECVNHIPVADLCPSYTIYNACVPLRVCLWCRKKQSAARADAVTLGDAWLAPAIKAGLLQPIPDAQNSTWWVSRSP